MYSSSPSIEHLFAQLLAPYSYYQLTACKLEIYSNSQDSTQHNDHSILKPGKRGEQIRKTFQNTHLPLSNAQSQKNNEFGKGKKEPRNSFRGDRMISTNKAELRKHRFRRNEVVSSRHRRDEVHQMVRLRSTKTEDALLDFVESNQEMAIGSEPQTFYSVRHSIRETVANDLNVLSIVVDVRVGNVTARRKGVQLNTVRLGTANYGLLRSPVQLSPLL